MRTALTKIAIVGVLFFGCFISLAARAQDANEPSQLADDLANSENDAISTGDDDLDGLVNRAEKSAQNELQKDVGLVESAVSTPTPSLIGTALVAPTPDDSLKEIEREVDSLEAQSKALSK